MVRIYDPVGHSGLKKIRYYTAIIHSNIHPTGIYESHDYLEIKKYSRQQTYSFFYEPIHFLVYSYVQLYSTNVPYHFIERWGIQVKPIKVYYDPYINSIIVIQRCWKKIFVKRTIAKFVICKHIYRALLNPYTQLGKNRLLRDFLQN
jgi:hypothetical protein